MTKVTQGTGSPTALITGANKGIGLEIARQLGGLGFEIWLGCRDKVRGETAALLLKDQGINAIALTIDVTNPDSIASAFDSFSQTNSSLDVLVNNAGIAGGHLNASPSNYPVQEMREVFEVNTFGPVRMLQAFLPLLLKSPRPRVVNVSSSLGSISLALDPTSDAYGVNLLAYNSSKAALNMITALFAKELIGKVKVNAVNPGFTATDLNSHMGHRSAVDAAAVAVRLAMIAHDGPTAGFFHDGYHDSVGRHPW